MVSTPVVQSSPRLDYVVCSSPSGVHRMAYWEWGDPSNKKVLLCVHGLTRTGRDFDALAQALSSEYRVICPDIVGRGKSDFLVDPDSYIVPQYVADIFTLIARLQPTTLDWVGTSMGGLIGLGVVGALTNLQRLHAWDTDHILNSSWAVPFRRMVLNDVGPVISAEGLARIGNYIGDELFFDSFEQAVEHAKKQWKSFGPHTQEQWEHLTRYVFHQQDGQWNLTYDLGIATPFKRQFIEQNEAASELLVQAAQKILWDAYESLPAETLIVRGETSDLLSDEVAQQMLQRLPSAQLYQVAGVGHAPTFMSPDQIAVLKRFLLKE